VKVKQSQKGLNRSLFSRMLRLLGFLHNRRVKLARLSALYTHNLYPKEIPLVHISVTG